MSDAAKTTMARFNALSLRERSLLAVVAIVVPLFGWWHLYAQPAIAALESQKLENARISTEVNSTILAVNEIRKRIDEGVHREKEQRLLQLKARLAQVEADLKLKTIELINPEDMFNLMSQMVYQESKLKLLGLKRLEVKPAITPTQGEENEEAEIYRHVLEVKFSGGYSDILSYIQTLEELDWKLIWDEIEIVSDSHPSIIMKLVVSTLSTRKEWVGV